jgi:very-short-patch-repair endonuclease
MHKLTSPAQARRQLLAGRAWFHRREASEPERQLWEALRAGKLGVTFRRQVVAGPAIADFLAPAIRLVVEVDGRQHRERRAADGRRDRNLRRLGYHVLRIEAEVVLGDLPRAVALVRERVARLRR